MFISDHSVTGIGAAARWRMGEARGPGSEELVGWQWVAGSGPDAAPYFRVFNPETQAQKFDPVATYRQKIIAELSPQPGPEALAWFDAVPRAWALDPKARYPERLITLDAGRLRALKAYETLRKR